MPRVYIKTRAGFEPRPAAVDPQVADLTTLLYKKTMSARRVSISEARRQLSALVERVAHGAGPITIGRYGRERAVLVGADEYARLTRAGRGASRYPGSLEGTLTLTCSPEALEAESGRIGDLWLATVRSRSASGARPTRRR